MLMFVVTFNLNRASTRFSISEFGIPPRARVETCSFARWNSEEQGLSAPVQRLLASSQAGSEGRCANTGRSVQVAGATTILRVEMRIWGTARGFRRTPIARSNLPEAHLVFPSVIEISAQA